MSVPWDPGGRAAHDRAPGRGAVSIAGGIRFAHTSGRNDERIGAAERFALLVRASTAAPICRSIVTSVTLRIVMPEASGMRFAFIVTSAVAGSGRAGRGCCALMVYSIAGHVAWTPRPREDRITLFRAMEKNAVLRSWSDRNVVALPACEATSKKRPLPGARQPAPGKCPGSVLAGSTQTTSPRKIGAFQRRRCSVDAALDGLASRESGE